VKVNKFDIAREQLITALSIFFNQNNYSSVITLAGAASGILSELVRREGKQPFLDYARDIHLKHYGYIPKRVSYSHHIAKTMGISAHKHLSLTDPDEISLDIEYQAYQALVQAIADYKTLKGASEPFIQHFFRWAYKNMDGEKTMQQYLNSTKGEKP
jgi:hypothetical protein